MTDDATTRPSREKQINSSARDDHDDRMMMRKRRTTQEAELFHRCTPRVLLLPHGSIALGMMRAARMVVLQATGSAPRHVGHPLQSPSPVLCHVTRQSSWNRWKHGVATNLSPLPTNSEHTTHSVLEVAIAVTGCSFSFGRFAGFIGAAEGGGGSSSS